MSKIRSPSLTSVTNAVMHDIWAITPEMHARLQDIVLERMQGQRPDVTDLEARIAGQSYGAQQTEQDSAQVAVVSLHGVLISRAGLFDRMSGATSPQAFAGLVRSYADNDEITAIVLDVDTPGGTVSGTQLAAEAVRYATTKKRTVACVNDMACSAGYWIAAQAGEIVTLSNATLGSIGVLTTHIDASGWYANEGLKPTVIRSADLKALGQDSEPMTGKALEQTQVRLQAHHDQFVQAVAAGRRVTPKKAAAWATGQTWLGEQAVANGLADRLGSINDVLAELLDPTPEEAGQEPDSAPPVDDVAHAPPHTANSDRAPPAAEQTPSATDDPPAPTEAGSSTTPTPARDAQEDAPMNIAAISAKLAAGGPLTAEERRFLDQHLTAQSGPPAPDADVLATPAAGVTAPPAPQIDLSALSPEARAAVEQAQRDADAANKRAERAEQTANTERDQRLNREFAARAVTLGQPAAFGATLRAASEKLSGDEYQAVEQAVNASGAQATLLGETGSQQDRRDSGHRHADYQARVAQVMKDHPGLSRAQAADKVMADDPEFARRYRG